MFCKSLCERQAIPRPVPLRAVGRSLRPPLPAAPRWHEGTRWNRWANHGYDQCLRSQTSFMFPPPPPPPAIIPIDGHSNTLKMSFLPLMANQLSTGNYKEDVKVWGNSVSAQIWMVWDTRKCFLGWEFYEGRGTTRPMQMLWHIVYASTFIVYERYD